MLTRILFIHHSTGANIIKEGHLREILKQEAPLIELWDHSYNLYTFFPQILTKYTYHTGLSNQNGTPTNQDYHLKISNNSPQGYADIFSQDPTESPLQDILEYDVIAFKNCYPTTNIGSETKLESFQELYKTIRDNLKKYPNKKFVLLTPPPLRKSKTNLENAKRAQELVHWLTSDDYKADATNLSVFDMFTFLSDQSGCLKPEYCRSWPFDSHPNPKANKAIAPLLADFFIKIIT